MVLAVVLVTRLHALEYESAQWHLVYFFRVIILMARHMFARCLGRRESAKLSSCIAACVMSKSILNRLLLERTKMDFEIVETGAAC